MRTLIRTSERAGETWRDLWRRIYAAIAFLSTTYFVVTLLREVSFATFVEHLFTAESFLLLIVGATCAVLSSRLRR
jgi:hypothetical protein